MDYKEYFESNSDKWIRGAYENTAYEYPVGFHRLRILKKCLGQQDLGGKRVLDIGCGSGAISQYLASKGAEVTAIDMSKNMLKIARESAGKAGLSIDFQYAEFEDLRDARRFYKYDIIIAFGLIGYLKSDDFFFDTITKLSAAKSLVFVSCRNELFNITSISSYTEQEIVEENAINLINEINEYYDGELPKHKIMKFVETLADVSENIRKFPAEECELENLSLEMPTMVPRQSTPKLLSSVALTNGYKPIRYFGIHPHLLLPRFNKMLPPQVFNKLSDTLCVFEDEKISLIWSSVFIGVFEYGEDVE